MAIKILMPALSPTMTEGNLAKWLKKEGDKIKPGEIIAEIETDKATMEVESADSGILGKIVVPEKTNGVKVNELIAVLLEAGEKKDAAEKLIAEYKPVASAQPKAQPEPVKAVASAPQVANAPVMQQAVGGRVFASPLAKRIASQNGVILSSIKGSGPKGRIIKGDVLNARGGNFTQVGRSSVEYSTTPHSQMRTVIAKRLQESKQHIPHYYLTIDCDITDLLKAREEMNKKLQSSGGKVSVNDFVIKAAAHALKAHPAVNSSWSDEGMIRYNNIDISVAVAIPDGLITPIVQNADQKSFVQIAAEVKELAAKAKSNSLKPHEFQGGSFTISNLGMYGIKEFQAIINPPQSCILAVGTAEERVVVKNGEIGKASIMTVSISCDHRVVDGATGAEFLSTFKSFIEQPILMFV